MVKREVSPHKIMIEDGQMPVQPGIGRRHVSSNENKPYKQLVNMVREVGVLNPIRVRTTDDGDWVLDTPGHYFRLMAAREANLEKVKVEIVADA